MTLANVCAGHLVDGGCVIDSSMDVTLDDQVEAGLDGDLTILGDNIVQVTGGFDLIGGTIDTVTYGATNVTGDGSNGNPFIFVADSMREVIVTFTVNTTGNVVLAWGGHIATNPDWLDMANPSGSPYHMRTTLFSCNNPADSRCSAGSQDLALTGAAIVATASLQLQKTWVNAVVGDNITAATSGFGNNASVDSTAGTPSESDTGTAVEVEVGESGTLSGETFNTGSSANYNTSAWSCDGTDADPSDGLLIDATDAGNTITCTISNSRKSAQLQLKKDWTNAIVNDAVSAATTGFSSPSSNATLASTADTAGDSDTGTAVTVYVGDTGLLVGETFTTGLAANYTASSWTCSGTDTNPEDNLDIVAADAGSTITCTISNSRKSAQLQLKKDWTNAIVNDAVSAATTGFSSPSSNATLASTADTAGDSDTGTAVTVYVGDTGLLVGETFTTGLAANYTASSWTCSGTDTNPEDNLDIVAADAGKHHHLHHLQLQEVGTVAVEEGLDECHRERRRQRRHDRL